MLLEKLNCLLFTSLVIFLQPLQTFLARQILLLSEAPHLHEILITPMNKNVLFMVSNLV